MNKDIDYTALGNRIRTARKKQGITQEKLGEICSLSAAHIGHIERGTRIPSLETLYRISTELRVSMDYLLFDSAPNFEAALKGIAAGLEGKPQNKVKVFLSTVKALADKIDEI